MKIELEYGRSGLEVDLPENARPTIITKPKMALLGLREILCKKT